VRSTSLRAYPLLVLGACTLGCELFDPGPDCFRIFGAASSAEDVVPREVLQSVGMLGLTDDPDDPFSSACTGSLVSPGVVATAAHCLADPASVTLTFAATSDHGQWQCDAATPHRSAEHPWLDVALYFFEEDEISVPPLRLADTIPPVGTTVVIAGFGLDESGDHGTRKVAQTRVVYSAPDIVVVEHPGDVGACLGDSGGPVLWERDGAWSIAGSLSTGDASCVGQDNYVASAIVQDWIRSETSR